MEIIQFAGLSMAIMLGLLAGAIISYLAKDEQLKIKNHLGKIIVERQQRVYSTMGLVFAALSQTKYLLLASTIIFLYSILAGSFLFLEKKYKEIAYSAAYFVLVAIVFKIALF